MILKNIRHNPKRIKNILNKIKSNHNKIDKCIVENSRFVEQVDNIEKGKPVIFTKES